MDECMQIVGVDDIMDILLTEWQRDMRAKESHILNIFEAGDVDGDSVLTAAEFEGIVRRIDPSTDSSKCLSMYREALQLSPAEGLVDKTTFLCIAKQHHLVHLASVRKGRIGSMDQLKQCWQTNKPYVLSILEALGNEERSAVQEQQTRFEKAANPTSAWMCYGMLLEKIRHACGVMLYEHMDLLKQDSNILQ